MFNDAKRELERLSEELLKEDDEETPEEGEEEEYYDDADEDEYDEEDYDEDAYDEEEDTEEDDVPPEYMYEDTRAAQGPAVYQNYSNGYGSKLRNYASGYRAYNSDDCDVDLDAFSQEVYEEPPEKSNMCLVITACVLATILGAVALFLVLQYKGVL